jgi:hypothetical protein
MHRTPQAVYLIVKGYAGQLASEVPDLLARLAEQDQVLHREQAPHSVMGRAD